MPADRSPVTLWDLFANEHEGLSREERMRDTIPAPLPPRDLRGDIDIRCDSETIGELLRFGVQWNEIRDFLDWLTLPSIGAYSPGGFARHLRKNDELSTAVRQYRQWQNARSCQ